MMWPSVAKMPCSGGSCCSDGPSGAAPLLGVARVAAVALVLKGDSSVAVLMRPRDDIKRT